ncbi:hypothetical protein NQD34_015512 [Periophthalmus magnuspinnatus]|nr:hypothetical protein NQD34_015512 [Periophthalmus magnuspinnatus]
MADIHQRWRGHKNDLQHPKSNVRDWEGLIVAHIFTSRLLSVAHVVRLLIAPNKLSSGAQYKDTKNEQNCEPHPADHRRVLVDFL